MRTRPLVAALLLALPLAGPARAGLFSDDEARRRVEQVNTDLGARNAKLQVQLDQAQSAQLDLSNQIESLKSELAKLRGENEVLKYELEAHSKRQKDFYLDLDTRLRKLETAGEAPKKDAAEVDPALEGRDYEAALILLKGGRFKEASGAFEQFIKTWPKSQYVPSAHYWAASASFQARDYNRAAEYFQLLVNGWPQDARAPDAMLGLANTQQELNDAKGARKTLTALVAQYPGTPAADTAKQRLGKPAAKK